MLTIQARHYRSGRRKPVRLIVIHDMEAPENATTAESVARFFATTDREASAHVCVDCDSEVRCVADSDTAFGAGGANDDGLHIEHAGYARQNRSEWLDVYSRAMLRRSAKVVAAWCRKYDIPPVRLTVADLLAGKRGLCGHVDVTNAYHKSTHTDPGVAFPWDWYLSLVKTELARLSISDQPVPKTVVVKTSVWAAMKAAGLATTVATVTAVLVANGIDDPTKVQPGQVITIPGPVVTVTTPAPTPTTVVPRPAVVAPKPPAFPGRQYFKPGARNAHVTALGRQLVRRGYGRFYAVGPGPRWSSADRRAVRTFQLAHPQLRGDADGYPGPLTWKLLFSTSKGK